MAESRSVPAPPRLYAIADREALGETGLVDGVVAMAAAGVRWVQVRAKRCDGGTLYRELEACCQRLEGSEVSLWIDDRVDLAALLPVAGVQVGQEDLPPTAARAVVGEERWIGRSTHSISQAVAAAVDPDVDVVAIGPVFPTSGKERPDPVVGLKTVREVRRLVDKPLLAIGGIAADNCAEVLRAGADAVVSLGAVCRGDVAANCRRLLRALEAA